MLRSPLRGMAGQSGGGSTGPLFIPGAQFDGVTDFMVNSAFPIPPSSPFLMARFSFYLTGDPGYYNVIYANNSSSVLFYIHPDGNLQFIVNGIGPYLAIRSTDPIPFDSWQTVLFACDTNHPSGSKPVHLWINGINSLGFIEDQYPAFTISHSSSVTLGALPNENLKLEGALAGMWVGCGQYLDFSDSVNRLKFTDGSGKPKKNLGVDGSLPTGTAPDIYLNHNYLSFQTNEGTAGDFTVYGALSEPGSEVPAA